MKEPEYRIKLASKAFYSYHCVNWSYSPPPLRFNHMWYVNEGNGQVIVDGERYDLEPGVIMVMPPGSIIHASHDLDCPVSLYYCRFMIYPPMPIPTYSQISDHALMDRLWHLAAYHFFRKDLENPLSLTQSVVRTTLSFILQPYLSHKNCHDECINRVMEAIRQDPTRSWAISECARLSGLSRSQFARRFRDYSGMPPGAFIIRERVWYAVELLEHTSLNMQQIAEKAGYSDVYFFSRQVKQVTGKSPKYHRN